MKKQYTWSSEKDAETYNKDVHSTVKGCINEAKEYGATTGDKIYVGECENFTVSVDSTDVENIFERLADKAYYFADDIAENWIDDLEFPKEDIESLSEKLTKVITDFLIEHNAMPNFYQVNDIREVIVK